MAQPLETKLTYRPSRKLQVFFTGGAARVSRDGKLLVCACGDEVKVRIDGVAGHRYRRAMAAGLQGCEQQPRLQPACMGCWVVCLVVCLVLLQQMQSSGGCREHRAAAVHRQLQLLRRASSISDNFQARSIGKHRAVTYLQDCNSWEALTQRALPITGVQPVTGITSVMQG